VPGTSVSTWLETHAGSPHADFSTLMMEAIRASETSVNARSAQRHFPEDILHSHRCESLKSYRVLYSLCSWLRIFYSCLELNPDFSIVYPVVRCSTYWAIPVSERIRKAPTMFNQIRRPHIWYSDSGLPEFEKSALTIVLWSSSSLIWLL
jgi:hypothetical protein